MTKKQKKPKREPKTTEVIFYVPQEVVITYEFGLKLPTKKVKDLIRRGRLEEYLRANLDKAVERGEDECSERQYGDYDLCALEVDEMSVPEVE